MEQFDGPSEFNMAVAYLQRLHVLLMKCDESSIMLDCYGWYHTLTALYRELSTEIKEEHQLGYGKTLRELNQIVVRETNIGSRTGRNGMTSELYFGLHQLEIDLRKVMKDRGLQNKTSQDPSRAVFNG